MIHGAYPVYVNFRSACPAGEGVLFESHQITIKCSKCGHEFPESIGRLKTNPTLICLAVRHQDCRQG